MSDPMTDRLPPHNQEAERGVIGGILRDPDELSSVQQIIRADNFYFDAHQKIYQAICDLADEHQPLDLVMLHERLKKNKQSGGHRRRRLPRRTCGNRCRPARTPSTTRRSSATRRWSAA